jgi:hypothetical protein
MRKIAERFAMDALLLNLDKSQGPAELSALDLLGKRGSE